LSRGLGEAPGFDAVVRAFDASAVGHACSSSRRAPDPLVAGRLRSRFPPRLLTDMTLRWFGLSACTANPEGRPPSLAQHGPCWRPSTSSSRSFQDTPPSARSAASRRSQDVFENNGLHRSGVPVASDQSLDRIGRQRVADPSREARQGEFTGHAAQRPRLAWRASPARSAISSAWAMLGGIVSGWANPRRTSSALTKTPVLVTHTYASVRP
jgi:hypothetical protein